MAAPNSIKGQIFENKNKRIKNPTRPTINPITTPLAHPFQSKYRKHHTLLATNPSAPMKQADPNGVPSAHSAASRQSQASPKAIPQSLDRSPIMAANSIIAAISIVPWGQVLEAAPKVAESAAKLWNVVAGRNKEEGINQEGKAAASPLEEVRSEVAAIQRSIDELKEEMQAATMVIKALAE